MPAPTKKPHTENVDIRFTGPKDNLGEAIKRLRSLGFVDTSDSVPWRGGPGVRGFPFLQRSPSWSTEKGGYDPEGTGQGVWHSPGAYLCYGKWKERDWEGTGQAFGRCP